MAQSTVDIQKMKNAASELDKIYSSIQNQLKKMEETVTSLKGMWKGEAAGSYLNTYSQHSQNFQNLANSMKSCSTTLVAIAGTYGKADAAAAEVIKQKMGGRK